MVASCLFPFEPPKHGHPQEVHTQLPFAQSLPGRDILDREVFGRTAGAFAIGVARRDANRALYDALADLDE